MDRPELKQIVDLKHTDFEKHPVWINCHVEDYDEPWYSETDEETFRPWSGPLPVDPSTGICLVRATFMFRDGSQHIGFLTPSAEQDLGVIQPHVFIGDRFYSFWGGAFGRPLEERTAFYRASGREAKDIFPLSFEATPGLALGICQGKAEGFYKQPKRKVEVEW